MATVSIWQAYEFVWTGIGHKEQDWPNVRPHPRSNWLTGHDVQSDETWSHSLFPSENTDWIPDYVAVKRNCWNSAKWCCFPSIAILWHQTSLRRLHAFLKIYQVFKAEFKKADYLIPKLQNVHVTIKSPNSHTDLLLQRHKTEPSTSHATASAFQVVSVISLNTDTARCDTNRGRSFRNSRQRGPVGCQMSMGTSCWSLGPGRLSCYSSCVFSDLTFLQDRPTLLSSPVLVRGQGRAFGGTSQLLELKSFSLTFRSYERIYGVILV